VCDAFENVRKSVASRWTGVIKYSVLIAKAKAISFKAKNIEPTPRIFHQGQGHCSLPSGCLKNEANFSMIHQFTSKETTFID